MHYKILLRFRGQAHKNLRIDNRLNAAYNEAAHAKRKDLQKEEGILAKAASDGR